MSQEQQPPEQSPAHVQKQSPAHNPTHNPTQIPAAIGAASATAIATAADDAGTQPRRRARPAATPATPSPSQAGAQALKHTPATSSGRRKTAATVTPPAPAAAPVADAAHAFDGAPPPAATAPLAKLVRKALPIKEARPKKASSKKARLVRDSFTFPENDYALFATLKQRALAAGGEIKKSELVRAGLALLNKLDDAELARVLGKVERIKTGRPKKK